jgi:hypothetical protein
MSYEPIPILGKVEFEIIFSLGKGKEFEFDSFRILG